MAGNSKRVIIQIESTEGTGYRYGSQGMGTEEIVKRVLTKLQ